ncbi:MAG: universal stress protein [Cyanobacteria bacterium J069]|nr:MAG: universal stress protein [Cyanobacteria bacterium J069]
MFKRALICTDFKDGLYRFARFVPSLAAAGLEHIAFLHTIPVPEGQIPRETDKPFVAAREHFASLLGEVPAGVDVQVEVAWGKPVEHILSARKKYQSDIIFIGTAGDGLLKEKLFGSTPVSLCQQSSVPLLILRPQLISAYTEEELDLRARHLFRYLLLPYDGSEAGQAMLQQVKALAANRPAGTLECALLFTSIDDVGRNPVLREAKQEEAVKRLEVAKQELEALGIKTTMTVTNGNAVTQALETAVDVDITAIAASSKTVGRLVELSVPSFTGDLLRRSWHPILFFPPS